MGSTKRPAGAPPAVGARFQTRIEKLAIGGAGIARPDGFVLFTPETAPGDLVELEVTEVRGNHGSARVLRLLEKGPDRREPPCPYARDCGGCNWQHLTDEAQREQKQILLRETLERFLPGVDLPLEPLVPSPRALRYRNRVQPLRREGRLGFRKRRSHDFLPVDDCPITEEPLAALFKNPPPGADDARIELRLTPDGRVEISEAGDEEGFAFAQVNRFQNQDLLQTVLEWTRDLKPTAVWDLYSGAGNFSFPLIDQFSGVPMTGVELNHVLVKRAREESRARKDKDVSFLVSDVAAWVRRHTPPSGSLVVLDPPRAGAGGEVMAALRSSDVKSLVLIGCHPVSLARDLSVLLKDSHFRLTKVRAFEMFPQTDHFETMALVEVDSP